MSRTAKTEAAEMSLQSLARKENRPSTQTHSLRPCAWLVAAALALTTLGATACGPGIYELPDPPPKDEWVDVHATEDESDEVRIRRFLDAKRVAISTYAALQSRDWDTALNNMSQETRAFLQDASGDNNPASALESGQLLVGDQTITFDPVADFFIAGLEDLRDEMPGKTESETLKRKEIYAIGSDGKARKVVFIVEGEAWRFHSPFVRTPTFSVQP